MALPDQLNDSALAGEVTAANFDGWPDSLKHEVVNNRTNVAVGSVCRIADASAPGRYETYYLYRRRVLTMAWFGSREGKEQPLFAASSRLIEDTEAFLSGDYASQLRRHGDAVPGWAQLNNFAHGNIEILHSARRPFVARKSANCAGRSEGAWSIAQRLLAGEIIQLVGTDPWILAHLQQCVLVPLELQLMCRKDLTAFELVQLTRSALRSSTP
jgi:hypothetical protein